MSWRASSSPARRPARIDAGHGRQPGHPGRPPAALAADDDVDPPALVPADADRLELAAGLERLGEAGRGSPGRTPRAAGRGRGRSGRSGSGRRPCCGDSSPSCRDGGGADRGCTLVRGVVAPLVADAGRCSRSRGDWRRCRQRPGPTALTPHAGELAGCSSAASDEVTGQPPRRVGEAVESSGAAMLLKGPDTLVAAPGEPLRIVEPPCRRRPRPPAPATRSLGTVAALCWPAGLCLTRRSHSPWAPSRTDPRPRLAVP